MPQTDPAEEQRIRLIEQTQTKDQGLLSDHHGQLKKVWDKIDECETANDSVADRVSSLEHHNKSCSVERPDRLKRIKDLEDWRHDLAPEHKQCMKRHDGEDSIKTDVTKGVISQIMQLLPWLMLAGMAAMMFIQSKFSALVGGGK